jgi:DNA-binding MarR family transcriptional regulator
VTKAEDSLTFVLQLAAHRLRTVSDRRSLEIAGITAAQAGVMFAIESDPGRNQRSLATVLGQQESAITTMIRRLEKAGLVQREARADDRRAFSLSLTRRGQATLDRLRGELDDLNSALQAALGKDHADQLAADLAKIVQLVDSHALASPG